MPMGGETSQMGGGMGGGGVPSGGAGPGGANANSFKTPEACRYGPAPLVERRVSPLRVVPAVAPTLGLAPSRGLAPFAPPQPMPTRGGAGP